MIYKEMKSRNNFFIVFVIILPAVIFAVSQYRASQWNSFRSEKYGITLSYPSSFERDSEIQQNDMETKILFRATGAETEIPSLVSVRFETGLRIAVSFSKQDIMDMLLGNADKAFPLRYEKYKKISERKFEKDDEKAAELNFSYVGPAGKPIRQRLMIISKLGDSAFYISAQAENSDFEELNKKYFNKIFASIRIMESM